ncbi:EPHX3 [Symbiodinium sp. CCMP2592]|nr:EPHX3 [Symbiodinium sp. CCMP2592]
MAMSLRGCGLSDKPLEAEMYDLETCLVADMRAGLDYVRQTCGQQPLLVAHGVGALIGWRLLTLTADAPEVAGFVSLSMPPLEACARGLRSLSQLYSWLYILAFSMPKLPEALLTFQNAFLGAVLLNDLERAQVRPELLHLSRANLLQPRAARGHLNYYRMLVRKMMDSVLHGRDTYWSEVLRGQSEHKEVLGSHHKLKLPVLILKGSHDHICKEGLFADLSDYLHNYRFVVIEPCSHRVHLDAMAEVNTEISQWLQCL